MRAYELRLDEIERVSSSDYVGGRQYLRVKDLPNKFLPLPGGSKFLYSLEKDQWFTKIKIWDPEYKSPEPEPQPTRYESTSMFNARLAAWRKRKASGGAPRLIGKLELNDAKFPINRALRVDTITVDERYRGQNIATSLYGIVLSILKRPLLAGDQQTPGGRSMWAKLNSIPGVKVRGYFTVIDEELDDEEVIDVIMSKLGGDYLGKSKYGTHYFSFDVVASKTKQELESYVKQQLVSVYHRGIDRDIQVGLYAVWEG